MGRPAGCFTGDTYNGEKAEERSFAFLMPHVCEFCINNGNYTNCKYRNGVICKVAMHFLYRRNERPSALHAADAWLSGALAGISRQTMACRKTTVQQGANHSEN